MDSVAAPSEIEGLDSLLPLLEEARHEEALPLIEDSLTKQPDVAVWKYLKALVIACQARGPEALELLKECSAKEGFEQGFGLPADVNTLAKASALNHLHFETTVDPTSLEPWNILEKFARLLKNDEFVERSVMGRWKTQPENEECYQKFQQFYSDQEPKAYVKLIGEVMSANPEACLPKAVLGAKMQEIGKTALAIRHLKDAHEADPQAWRPHYYLGQVFSAQSRFENAETQFAKAMELKGAATAELYGELAQCQKATYRFEEAAETLFKSLEEFPEQFQEWDQLAELAEATGLMDRYTEALGAASAGNTDSPDLAKRSVRLTLEKGDPLEALVLVENSGIKSEPGKSPELTKLAAEVNLALLEPELAVSLLEQALQTEPNNKELRLGYGAALGACRRAPEAEVILKETALQHPNDRVLQIAWGRALLETGEAERAYRAFGLASRLDPNDPEAMTEQALALLALDKAGEATPLLKEAAKKVDPPLSVTLNGLGQVYEKKGLRDISKDFYRQALTRDVASRPAAAGWLRLAQADSQEIKSQVLEFVKQNSEDYYRARLFLNFLHSALWEGLSDVARAFTQDILPQVKGQLEAPYQEFLERNLFRRVPELAAELERTGELERARSVWRFGVTCANSELSQKATAELLRLDTVEAALGVPEESNEPTPQAADSEESALFAPEQPQVDGDDPLLSLLSATLPEDAVAEPALTPEASAVEESLFAPPAPEPVAPKTDEVPLFAESPDVIAPQAGEAALFETSPAEVLSSEAATPDASENSETLESSLFAESPNEANQAALVPEAPVQEEANQAALVPEAPAQEEATQAALVPEAPAQEEATQAALVPEAPVQEEATQAALVPEAPAQEEATQSALVPEAPAQEEATQAALVPEAPAQEEATQAALVPEAPAQEEDTQAALVPEAPAQTVPVSEEPAQAESAQSPEAPDVAAPEESSSAPATAEQQATPQAEQKVEVAPEPLAEDHSVPVESHQDEAVEVAAEAAEIPSETTAEQPATGDEDQSPTPIAEATPRTEDQPVETTPSEQPDTTVSQQQPPTDQLADELNLEIEPDDEAAPPQPEPAQVEPQAEAVSVPTAPVQATVAEGKDLLPIMAVDFEPNTRRQLHFHEALTQRQAGVVTPEAIAHLMVTSSLSNEPPDPTSAEQNSLDNLLHALLRTAQGLGERQQYRAASRLLKTALLYSPESPEVTNALINIQVKWGHWLSQSGEFAHAVGLVRDSLRRAPESEALEAELQKIYQAWMTWSDDQGDPAARDLLAVYLQQEQASLESFRKLWQQRQAPPTPTAPTPTPPTVAPTMPEAQATPAAPVPPTAEPVSSAAETPPTPDPAPEEPAATPSTPEPVATSPTPVEAAAGEETPASEPTPVESTQSPDPTPVEPAPVQSAPASEATKEVASQPETVVDDTSAAAPEPVAEEPAPVAGAPATPSPSAGGSYSNSEEALAALDAAPTDEAVCEAVFAYHAGSMRTLTTALRDRASSQSDQPLWLLLLARAFRQSGSETMAVIQYQKYIKAAPSPEAYEELAQTYEEIGKEDFAKMTRRKAERAFSG